jgi:hypothetical protein
MFTFRSFVLVVACFALNLAGCSGCSSGTAADAAADVTVDAPAGDAAASDVPVAVDVVEAATPVDAAAPVADASLDAHD